MGLAVTIPIRGGMPTELSVMVSGPAALFCSCAALFYSAAEWMDSGLLFVTVSNTSLVPCRDYWLGLPRAVHFPPLALA